MLHLFLQQHSILKWVDSLLTIIQVKGWSPHLAENYEMIDCELMEGRQQAEHECAKWHTGQYFWSLTLAQAGEVIWYRKLWWWAAAGLPHSKHQLSKQQTDANIADKDAHRMTNLHQIEIKITEAWTNPCHCQANHLQLRCNHLTEVAEAITLKKHPWLEAPQYKQLKLDRMAQAKTKLKDWERQCQLYNKLWQYSPQPWKNVQWQLDYTN